MLHMHNSFICLIFLCKTNTLSSSVKAVKTLVQLIIGDEPNSNSLCVKRPKQDLNSTVSNEVMQNC